MEPKTFLKGVAAYFIIKWTIGIAVVVMLMAALVVTTSQPKSKQATSGSEVISVAQLLEADGKGGRNCWVAVDGKVYDLSESMNWDNGEHTTSEGQARCGADMSNVIDKSPHGRKMLDQLDVVGTLATS